jgi:hypothetical protein
VNNYLGVIDMKKLVTIFALLALCSANASTCLESNTLNGMTLSVPTAQELITAMQVQSANNPYYNYGNYTYGHYSNIPTYFQVVLNKIDEQSSRVQINYAILSAMPHYFGYYNNYSGMSISVMDAVSYPINDSNGIELRTYGSAYGNDTRGLLQIVIPELAEKPESANYTMYFKGQVVASGTLTACQQENGQK